MDVLLPAVASQVHDDAEIQSLAGNVRQWSQPSAPKKLTAPLVVISPAGGPDETGLHGAATNPEIEVDVWGYGPDMYPDVIRVAQRVSEVLLAGTTVATGVVGRWREYLGWKAVPEPSDERIVHVRATFRVRYWSRGRIEVVAS